MHFEMLSPTFSNIERVDPYLLVCYSELVGDTDFTKCSVHYECDSGQLTDTDNHEMNTKKTVMIDKLTVGDKLTVQMSREVLLDNAESTVSSLFMNPCPHRYACMHIIRFTYLLFYCRSIQEV